MKRVFLFVLDSFGIGEMNDAKEYGDIHVNTLKSVYSSEYFHMPNMGRLGLFEIDGVAEALPQEGSQAKGVNSQRLEHSVVARMMEQSKGKDTTIGHWEIAGIQSDKPLPTYPDGFPQDIIQLFEEKTGRKVLCNKPYSGTDVLKDYGAEHVKTGALIVYTSADSVFQIAAHEEIVPCEQLYEYCHIAREILVGEHGVGRVIARPFTGPLDGPYTRTSNRHDYSILPPARTMLDQLKDTGLDVIAVGKIQDIYAGKGITEYTYTTGNPDGIEKAIQYMDKDFEGLCFINLVDFDSVYGHRRDIDGYAKALSYFDDKLSVILDKLKDDDILMITADHGCDPGYLATTDHSREYTPFLMYGKTVAPKNLGTRKTFADIAATVLNYFGVKYEFEGQSMLKINNSEE